MSPSPLPLAIALAALAAAAPAWAHAPYETTVTDAPDRDDLPEERATSLVTEKDLERRLPRSAPEALHYEPGVFVQQTAHGQGAAYVRGLTGQQTVLLFDDIRLNNSTYRQGPNQYFFTLDAQTIHSIEVLRGGGSTRYGSDALGGVIDATPMNPQLVDRGWSLSPRASLRGATADRTLGGRLQLEGAFRRGRVGVGFLGGVGARQVAQLEAAGPIKNPDPTTPLGDYPYTPAFAFDGRTQLGTGFKEVTADGRLVVAVDGLATFTAAAYLYRQTDAPRTDQCPPPAAAYNTCLTYEEQFRHLAYLAADGDGGRFARRIRVALSYQQQHERQRLDQPQLFARFRGLDVVDTVGVNARFATDRLRLPRGIAVALLYGADTYFDRVRSSASQGFTDVNIETALPRGQYLDGASYLYGGLFVDGELFLPRQVTVRAGGRFSWFVAGGPADSEAGGQPLDRRFFPLIGHLGVEWRPHPIVHLLANVDYSFRAPNLDDLTGRLQSGPGFQYESATLDAEKATTLEVGARLRSGPVVADLWAFETLIDDLILKVPRDAGECPPGQPQCAAAWGIFQLQNAPGLSEVRGLEASLRAALPWHLTLRATLGYTWGEGPRLGSVPREPKVVLTGDRIPLSRVPPCNGSAELYYRHGNLAFGAALRWAAPQDRLALEDYRDGRIPKYGTPGFAVVNLHASYRLFGYARIAAVLENLLDSAYRYHGSGVNGPGRGFLLSLESALY